MNKDFAEFQREFKKYQQLMGLTGYKIYFKFEPLDSGYASISIDQTSMVATVRFDSECPATDKPFRDIKMSAKHEAIHLLIGRLETRAKSRYVLDDEIYEATEEIVYKLEKLIK